MVAPRSLFQLLTEALQESRPGMAPDDPAAIARRYPQSGVSNSSNAEAQTRFPPPADVPPRDPNFRQLSRAPIAVQAQDSGKSNVQPNSPDYLWTEPTQKARSFGQYADNPLPWWAPQPPPFLLAPGRRFAVPRAGGLGGPTPLPWPSGPSSFRMPEISELPEAWKLLLWPLVQTYPEHVRKRLLGELDESKDADTAAGAILELYQKRRRDAGSKRPATILNGPSVVPDADADVSASVDDRDWCQRRYDAELKKCWKNFPKSKYGECTARATERWDKCNKSFKNTGGPPLEEPEEYDGFPD